jgi:pimeloyl-ACP methyl ester carboxylesterase
MAAVGPRGTGGFGAGCWPFVRVRWGVWVQLVVTLLAFSNDRGGVVAVQNIRGWPRLTAAIAGRAILPTVQGMHRAISNRAFRLVGPFGRPVQRAHDHIVGRGYDTVRGVLLTAGELGEVLAPRFGQADAEVSPAALKARAFAHGAFAEELLAGIPEFELDVSLWVGGAQVPLDRGSLQAAYPEATGALTVFVHGLVDSEDVWRPRTQDDANLAAVASAAGTTPLLVRYRTGRAIGRNGADLAQLLEAVTQAWPVPVTRIVVVGHSMGGLVARAACSTATAREHAWLTALSDVVYLGTPHLGSWLEKTANVGGWVLRRASTLTAPIAMFMDQRSRGIKDLRHGTLVEDGGEATVDGLLAGLVPDEPWLDGTTHHLVVGRLRTSAGHPLNIAFGDTLVRAGSARGTGRRRRIADGGPVVINEVPASHTSLVRQPAVGALLAELVA